MSHLIDQVEVQAALAVEVLGTSLLDRLRSRLRSRMNQTFANPAPHDALERSRIHPFAFARLRKAVSERPCWRISPTPAPHRAREVPGPALLLREHAARRIDDGGLGRRYPGGLCRRPIQGRAISDRFRGVGQGLDHLARGEREPRDGLSPTGC